VRPDKVSVPESLVALTAPVKPEMATSLFASLTCVVTPRGTWMAIERALQFSSSTVGGPAFADEKRAVGNRVGDAQQRR
jgi:hypothetical protein